MKRRTALPGGLLGRRFGDKRLVLVGLFLMVLGGLGLAAATSYLQANAARFLSGIGAVRMCVCRSITRPPYGSRPRGLGIDDHGRSRVLEPVRQFWGRRPRRPC